MLVVLTLLPCARAQDVAPKAAPEPQPPANTGPADPPAPGEAPAPPIDLAPPVLDAAALESLVAKLDDPSLMQREQAMSALRKLPGITLRAIEQYLRRPSLSGEQRVRLAQVGQSVFAKEPRAALGVSFMQGMLDDEDGHVQVDTPTAGWDSARVLRPLDVIRTIDGVRVRSRLDARAAIISHDPGDIIPIDILRNGQPGTVRVRLGNFADLGDRGFIDPAVHEASWRLRLSRSGGEFTKPLIVDLAQGEWSTEPSSDPSSRIMERMNHPITSEPLRTQMRQIPVSDVSASGPSRATGEREVNDFGQASLSIRSGPSRRELGGDVPNGAMPRGFARAMIESHRRMRDSLLQSVAHWKRLAEDPNITPERAAKILEQVADYEKRLAQVSEELNELERDAGDR